MLSEAICGLITLILGVAIAVEAQRISDPGADVIGPAAFPLVLGVMIAVCGGALCVMALNRARLVDERLPSARWIVLGAALALLVVYTHSLARVGFLIATALFVATCLALLGRRGLLQLAAAGIAVSVGIFVIFGLLLGVDLPKGRLFAG
jgi:putative tricarboxylic transport membrane protein